MDTPTIVHLEARKRFEIHLGRDVIGTAYYRRDPEHRIFTHTEIEPDYRGHGLATQLIEYALTDTRTEGLRVIALCPSVVGYLATHHDFDDLVDPADGVSGLDGSASAS